jgi:hypothetical protein
LTLNATFGEFPLVPFPRLLDTNEVGCGALRQRSLDGGDVEAKAPADAEAGDSPGQCLVTQPQARELELLRQLKKSNQAAVLFVHEVDPLELVIRTTSFFQWWGDTRG